MAALAVYNQDNREKVERDERKHEAEERVRKAKHDAAESEHRRQILLQRAHGGQQPPAVLQARSVVRVTLREHAAVLKAWFPQSCLEVCRTSRRWKPRSRARPPW